MRDKITLAVKGVLMGMAEVVPGVSGGTIAFITGIYETLIESISAVDSDFSKLLLRGKWKEAAQKINLSFLINLGIGMVLGFVIGVFVLSYLLRHHGEALWAFFFGLILMSCVYMARKVDPWRWVEWSLMLFAVLIAFQITNITPASGDDGFVFVFLSGMIAISALILPGLSGSFMLLILGMYGVVLGHVESLLRHFNTESLTVLFIFALGCIIGLMSFAKFLNYTFSKHRNPTLAVMIGFMLGSLNKLWPWRNPTSFMEKNTETIIYPELNDAEIYLGIDDFKLLTEQNVFPNNYFQSPEITLVIMGFLLGVFLMSWPLYLESKKVYS